MSDAARGQNAEASVRNWQSVRTILEACILGAVFWLASNVQDQTKASIRVEIQQKQMSDDIAALRTQLADVPALARSLATIEVELKEHDRRISTLEQEGRKR